MSRAKLVIVAIRRGQRVDSCEKFLSGIWGCNPVRVATLTKNRLPNAWMHAALGVPELLRLIFDDVELSDAHRLALVCRYSWNAAIPLIWKAFPEKKDLRALLELFPGSDTHQDLVCKVRRRFARTRCG